jgi:hypothetical protein
VAHLLQLRLVQSVGLGLGVLDENLVELGLDEPAKPIMYSRDSAFHDGHL